MFEEGRRYSLSELAQLLKESANESKPKIDPKVIKDDAQNNVKAVKDIMKQTSELDGGVATDEKRKTNPENVNDLNKTTLDNNFAYEPSKEYKDRVKAQVHGFTSVENEKISSAKENESLDFDGNKEFYDNNKKKTDEVNKEVADERHAGLKSHNLPKENFENKSLFTTESKKMKRLRFSHTTFLSEAQMLKKIPEAYKVDGNKFIMADKEGTEYMIECVKDAHVDYVYTNVVNRTNKKQLDEQFKRMKELAGYKSSDFNQQSTPQTRLTEDRKLSEMLQSVKKLNEKLNK